MLVPNEASAPPNMYNAGNFSQPILNFAISFESYIYIFSLKFLLKLCFIENICTENYLTQECALLQRSLVPSYSEKCNLFTMIWHHQHHNLGSGHRPASQGSQASNGHQPLISIHITEQPARLQPTFLKGGAGVRIPPPPTTSFVIAVDSICRRIVGCRKCGSKILSMPLHNLR